MKTNSSIDANLVKQFQSGNAQALTVLVKRWHKQFCKKAYWIVKDADQSKDVAQESWKIIIVKIHELKDPNKFASWAMRIVYSKSLDVVRETNKLRIRRESLIKTQDQEPESYQENNQLKKDLLNAIKSLPNNQQQIVKLFYTEDYALKEIAELLKISLGTAKSRLFHAREKLKNVLQQKRNY